MKDLRVVLIGSSLYAVSLERAMLGQTSAAGKTFLESVALEPGYEDQVFIEERDRWRVFKQPPFELRYDASRWYRDPEDREPGIINFFHITKRAEVQLIAEQGPIPGEDLETAVLADARESMDSINVKRRGARMRNGREFLDLEFEVRLDGATFINHGRYLSLPEASVQLRGWAMQANSREMRGDIIELLDGLTVTAPDTR